MVTSDMTPPFVISISKNVETGEEVNSKKIPRSDGQEPQSSISVSAEGGRRAAQFQLPTVYHSQISEQRTILIPLFTGEDSEAYEMLAAVFNGPIGQHKNIQ